MITTDNTKGARTTDGVGKEETFDRPSAERGSTDTFVSKCVYVVGASSSGKTTLCDALARDIKLSQGAYVKEVARTVMRTHGFTRADVGTFEMQSAIMTAQLRAESDVIEKSELQPSIWRNPHICLLSDRSAVDPIVYAASSAIEGSQEMASKLRSTPDYEAALMRYRQSIFVLLAPVQEWMKDDGVRSLEDPDRYCSYLRKELRDSEIPFHEIENTKDIHARVRIVKEWVNEGKVILGGRKQIQPVVVV